MSVDHVFSSASVSPFALADLFNLWRLPERLNILGVVPHVDKAIPLQRNVGIHLGYIGNC